MTHMPPDGTTVLFRALSEKLKFTAEEKRFLKNFARDLSGRIAERRSFTCVITNDSELRRLNHFFLGRDYATDVLSFPAEVNTGMLGEMAISAERAEVQALEFGHCRMDEIRILMLHGLLHLTGMDHERDHGEMARAERRWREEFDLPANLIARASVSRRTP